jgi:hypothetical protein
MTDIRVLLLLLLPVRFPVALVLTGITARPVHRLDAIAPRDELGFVFGFSAIGTGELPPSEILHISLKSPWQDNNPL